MKRPECSQRLPFTEWVPYPTKDCQRRLVGTACFLEIASLEVQVTQIADGETLHRPVSRLAMDEERSLEVSMGQIQIPQFEVDTAKAIETHPLGESVAHFAMNDQGTLKRFARCRRPTLAPVHKTQIAENYALNAPVPYFAAEH
jgi:hypothetical protein